MHQEATLRAFEAKDPEEAERIVQGFLRQMKDYIGSKLLPLKSTE
jgi:hypothetical protein